MTMNKLTLVVVLFAIIALSVAGTFLISKFSPQNADVVTLTPTKAVSQTPTQVNTKPTATQATFCQANQLSAKLTSQGAAGSIYDALEMTNTSTTPCSVDLGNTVTAKFEAKNIVTNDQSTVHTENFILKPNATVYSQVHYPNGPQCQSGITPQPISIFYKSDQTSIAFEPNIQTGKLLVQACTSESEKTTVDIWPLSKNPIQ
jgi:hypothetical protein